MSKDAQARYYKKSKEMFQKRLMKVIKIFLKNTKAKSNNMVLNDIKFSQGKKPRLEKVWKNKAALQIKSDWCFSASNRAQDIFSDEFIKLFLCKCKNILEIFVLG